MAEKPKSVQKNKEALSEFILTLEIADFDEKNDVGVQKGKRDIILRQNISFNYT
jgi:hypothetical protein